MYIIYKTYLLTSDRTEDEILEREANFVGATGVIRGSEHDVRSRYMQLAKMTNCEYLVRVTGDNPFTDFRAIEPLLANMVETKSQYCWMNPRCCPDGINLEVFTNRLLLESISYSKSSKDLEHVTPWMRKGLQGEELWLDWYNEESSNYHLGIDIKEDYFKIMRLLGENFYDAKFLESPTSVDWAIKHMIDSADYPKMRRHEL